MKIYVKTIQHEQQAYATSGDYWQEGGEAGTLQVRVSDMGDWRYEALVAVHEIVEAVLCRAQGVSFEDITTFDLLFESKRAADDDSEPGDAPSAPYQRQHNFATAVERMLCAALGIPWAEYEAANERLYGR